MLHLPRVFGLLRHSRYSAASSKVSKLIVQSKFLLENFKFWYSFNCVNPPWGHFGYPQNSFNSWKILKEHGGRRYQNTCCRAKILQYHVEFDWHLSLLSNQKVVFWRHTQTSESHVLLWLFHLHSCKNRFHNIVFVSWWKKINIITVSKKIMFSKFDFPKIHRFSYFVLF